jgi:hypothetical protein
MTNTLKRFACVTKLDNCKLHVCVLCVAGGPRSRRTWCWGEYTVWSWEERLTGEWRKLHNDEIYILQAVVLQTSLRRSDKDIYTYKMGGECNMHGRDGNSYKILAGNPECKPRYRWKKLLNVTQTSMVWGWLDKRFVVRRVETAIVL